MRPEGEGPRLEVRRRSGAVHGTQRLRRTLPGERRPHVGVRAPAHERLRSVVYGRTEKLRVRDSAD